MAKNTYETLIKAVLSGNIEEVTSLLQTKVEVNPTNRSDTPLIAAILGGKKKENIKSIVELLLHHGANLTTPRRDGYLPLAAAARKGYEEVVKLLLDKGADVNAQGATNTPLIAAVKSKDIKMIELLLSRGADPNIPSKDGTLPLLMAIEAGDIEVVKLLLNKGADVNAQGATNTPLLAAVKSKKIQMIELLFSRGANPNIPSKDGTLPLAMAIEAGEIEVVKLLLANGATISKETARSMILKAVKTNALPMVELIIPYVDAEDLNTKHPWLSFPLIAAAKTGNVEIATLLINKGAKVEVQTARSTPLYAAISSKNHAMITLLFSHGANVNFTSEQGDSPLTSAVYTKDITIATSLLEKGAYPNAGEKRPLTAAVEIQCQPMVELLLSRGATVPNLLIIEAARHPNTDIARLLLAKGATVNASYKDSSLGEVTPLSEAFRHHNRPMMELLLSNGAQPILLDKKIFDYLTFSSDKDGNRINTTPQDIQNTQMLLVAGSTVSCRYHEVTNYFGINYSYYYDANCKRFDEYFDKVKNPGGETIGYQLKVAFCIEHYPQAELYYDTYKIAVVEVLGKSSAIKEVGNDALSLIARSLDAKAITNILFTAKSSCTDGTNPTPITPQGIYKTVLTKAEKSFQERLASEAAKEKNGVAM